MRIFRKKAERRSRKQKNTVSLGLERLEDRRLMAGSIDLEGGILKIEGTSSDDTAIVQKWQNADYWITVTLQHDNHSHSSYFWANSVNRINFNAGEGDNYFRNDTGKWSNAFAGSGNDTMIGGSGVDALYGGGGNNRLEGREGNDTLIGRSNSNNTIYGGDGNDLIMGGAGYNRLYGDAGNDRLYGGNNRDVIFGGSGDDTLYGYSGNDYLSGGSGDDYLYGYNGDDILIGGSGNDKLYGQRGSDYLIGGSGNDYLDGGNGSYDILIGGSGSDTYVQYSNPWGFGTPDQIYGFSSAGGDRVKNVFGW